MKVIPALAAVLSAASALTIHHGLPPPETQYKRDLIPRADRAPPERGGNGRGSSDRPPPSSNRNGRGQSNRGGGMSQDQYRRTVNTPPTYPQSPSRSPPGSRPGSGSDGYTQGSDGHRTVYVGEEEGQLGEASDAYGRGGSNRNSPPRQYVTYVPTESSETIERRRTAATEVAQRLVLHEMGYGFPRWNLDNPTHIASIRSMMSPDQTARYDLLMTAQRPGLSSATYVTNTRPGYSAGGPPAQQGQAPAQVPAYYIPEAEAEEDDMGPADGFQGYVPGGFTSRNYRSDDRSSDWDRYSGGRGGSRNGKRSSPMGAIVQAENNGSTSSGHAAEFQLYLNAYRVAQANISDSLFPLFDMVLNGTNSSLIYDIVWSIYADLTKIGPRLVGPYSYGMHCFDWIEEQFFAENNITQSVTINNKTDPLIVNTLATHQLLIDIYTWTWQNATAIANQTGLLADLTTLASYMNPEDRSIMSSDWTTAQDDFDDRYFTVYNETIPSTGPLKAVFGH